MTDDIEAIRERVERGRAYVSDSKALLAEVDRQVLLVERKAESAAIHKAERDALRATIARLVKGITYSQSWASSGKEQVTLSPDGSEALGKLVIAVSRLDPMDAVRDADPVDDDPWVPTSYVGPECCRPEGY